MISTLSSFAGQFDSPLIEKARQLFDTGAVEFTKKSDLTWNAEVNDGKIYKTSVRVEDGDVTDIYCTCRSGTCYHTIAVMFALKKKLKIKSEAFQPEMLEPDPIYLVGPRINDLVYISRQAGSKNGELEKLGASLSLEKLDYKKMRSMVRTQLTGYDNSPIFNGAKKLLGAAILAIEEENYPPVFNIARAILTEICTLDMMSNSANECCRAAAALLEELYNLPNPSAELKDEVFDRVLAAWNMKLYEDFQEYLIPAITMTLQKKEHQEKALEKLEDIRLSYGGDRAVADARIRLLKLLGKPEEAKEVRYSQSNMYRNELIDEAFARKDYEEVKMWAREVKHHRPKELWNWIHKIALIENDIPSLREYYHYMYEHEGLQKKYYEALRDTYSSEEWGGIYLALMEKFEKDRSISKTEILALANIYLTEELDDKLAILLGRFPSYDLASMGLPLLEKNYPELLKKILKEHFTEATSACFTRDRTAIVHQEMKYCYRTPWGRKLMNEIRSYLLEELHPTWKIFRDELSKRM